MGSILFADSQLHDRDSALMERSDVVGNSSYCLLAKDGTSWHKQEHEPHENNCMLRRIYSVLNQLDHISELYFCSQEAHGLACAMMSSVSKRDDVKWSV